MHLKTVSLLLKNWGPVLLMMAIIFSFSHFQAASSDAQSGFFLNLLRIFSSDLAETKIAIILIRKFAHFFEYAVFGFLTARTFHHSNLPISCALFFCVTYAATDEYHQTFVAGRSGEIQDVLLDTAGALFGIIIYTIFHPNLTFLKQN